MYLLNNVFTTEHGEAITVLQLLTKFKSVLSEIDTYLNEYGNRLNSIEFLNATQQQEIVILKSQVSELQTRVNSIDLTLGDYLLRFTHLDVEINTINNKLTTNENDILQLQTYVNNIGTQIININNTLNLLDLTVQGHTTQITNLETSVDTINTTLSTHTTSINNLSTSLTDLTTLVNNLEGNLSDLTNLVNTLQNRIEYLETNDTWQNGQISSLITTSQLNTNNISALNTIVGNINDDIDALEILIQNGGDGGGGLQLDSSNLFENTSTTLEPTNVYNLWEYPANVDTDKTLVNIQTSFSTSGDNTQITIHTPNGLHSILPTSFGSAVNPATLNIDFMYKISSGVMEWYGIYTLLIKGKYPIIRYFSADTNYPNKENKTYPLANTHMAISFSDATVFIQPHVKISKYKIGG